MSRLKAALTAARRLRWLKVFAIPVTLVGVVAYLFCAGRHICMAGHMDHPPYPLWHYANDAFWTACLLSVSYWAIKRDRLINKLIAALASFLVMSRWVMGSGGGSNFYSEGPIAFLVLLATALILLHENTGGQAPAEPAIAWRLWSSRLRQSLSTIGFVFVVWTGSTAFSWYLVNVSGTRMYELRLWLIWPLAIFEQPLTSTDRSRRRPNEDITKQNLEAIRRSLSVSFEANGKYPMDLATLATGGKFPAKTPNFHRDSSEVRYGANPDDTGGWLYHRAEGRVWVNCTHSDTNGRAWNSY